MKSAVVSPNDLEKRSALANDFWGLTTHTFDILSFLAGCEISLDAMWKDLGRTGPSLIVARRTFLTAPEQ
jgi:hypothetical protein